MLSGLLARGQMAALPHGPLVRLLSTHLEDVAGEGATRVLRRDAHSPIREHGGPLGGSVHRVMGAVHLDHQHRPCIRGQAQVGIVAHHRDCLAVPELQRAGSDRLRHQRGHGPRGAVDIVDHEAVEDPVRPAPGDLLRTIGILISYHHATATGATMALVTVTVFVGTLLVTSLVTRFRQIAV